MTTAGMGYAAYQPQVQSAFMGLYDIYVGGLPKIIYDLSLPSIKSAYSFGLQILGLLFGWFVLLFMVELVLRVVVLTVGFVLRKVFSSSASADTDKKAKDE